MNRPIPVQPATPAVAESVGTLTRNERIVLKTVLAILALIFWASFAHAQTSSTRADLQTQNNAVIVPNGVGAITAPVLNKMLGNMIASTFTLKDVIPIGVWGCTASPSCTPSSLTTLPAGLTIPNFISLSTTAEPSLHYPFGGVATLNNILINVPPNALATSARVGQTIAIQGSSGNSNPNGLYTMGLAIVSQITGNAGSDWGLNVVASETGLTGGNAVQTIAAEGDINIVTQAAALASGIVFKGNFFASGSTDSSSHYAHCAYCAFYQGANPLWLYGFAGYDVSGPSEVKTSLFYDQTHAPTSYLDNGIHTNGIVMSGTYSGLVFDSQNFSISPTGGISAAAVQSTNGYVFLDRTATGSGWQWYATGGVANLFDQTNALNRISVAANGLFTAGYGLTVAGTTTLSALSVQGSVCNSAAGVLSTTTGRCAGDDPSDVTSVSNSDGTLTISPTTGAVVASIALTHANTWSNQTIAFSTNTLTGVAPTANPTFTGSVTATGLITNADLVSPTVTVNTVPCTLGSSCTISAAASLVLASTTISGTGHAINNLLFENPGGTLSEVATANSSVLVTSAGGVPSLSTTLPSGLSAASFTVTTAFTATGLVTNADLANSTITLGSTSMALGTTNTTIAGAITWSGTPSFSSNLVQLTNGTSNDISLGGAGAAAPGASSLGEKIQLFTSTPGVMATTDYALGVVGGNMWLNANGGFQFYNTGSLIATIGSAGGVAATSHFTATSTAPNISSCGTSPSIGGSDNFGNVTAGGGVLSSCIINFGTTWGAAPSCTVSSPTAISSLTVTTSTTQITIGGTSLTGDVIKWVCGSTASLEPRVVPANDNQPNTDYKRYA